MSDWKQLREAPEGVPLKVIASYDPSDRLMSYREMVGMKKFKGWWVQYGKKELRIFPTHWKDLEIPNAQND